jgi:thioesterase domain-containing protein
MPDVQLVLLNDQHQLTGVGELGEIYVRSPHLARGYLRDENLTEERFLCNPFTDVAADRLYKTEDLGRYLSDGTVEFAGRSDHQVKIRGFRIEPGEIEAVLSQHASVQEVLVMAREDAPGDRRLVAYLVLDPDQPPTASELHSFLKAKLPDYMIPAAFVMLDAFPLSPNAKVDRSRLPAPDRLRLDVGRTFQAPRDDLEHQLSTLWEQVLDVQPVGVRDNFFELGGHSMLAVRLLAQIEQSFHRQLPLITLFRAPTVEQLADVLRTDPGTESELYSSLIAMQSAGSRPPFFFVPGNLGNVFTDLGHLARYLGPDQPFYGFQDAANNPVQIEPLAAHYLNQMRAVQSEGPYFLGGICSGGVVAFEMAQQLQSQGEQVALLALVEPARPSVPGLRSYIGFATAIYHRSVRRLGRQSRTASQQAATNRGSLLRLKAKVIANLWALRRYAPQQYAGQIHMFLTRESLESPEHPRLGWRELSQYGAELHLIPGSHDTITGNNGAEIEEIHMQVLAGQLKACMDEALENS